MKRQRFFQLTLAVALGVVCAAGAQGAPKVDPQLKSKLLSARPTDLFGVILTFKGERVSEAQVAQVLGLGIRGGYRMQSLPVVAVNATRTGALRLTYDRVMSADGGLFRPEDVLTRMELARALMLGARVPASGAGGGEAVGASGGSAGGSASQSGLAPTSLIRVAANPLTKTVSVKLINVLK